MYQRPSGFAKMLALFVLLAAPASAFATGTSAQASLQTLPANECDLSSGGMATTPCPGAGTAIGPGSTRALPPAPPQYLYTGDVGARSIAGARALTAIDAFNLCYYVNNNSTGHIFVPFKSSAEWTKFIAYPPANVVLNTCAIAEQLVIAPDSTCLYANPANVTDTLPYGQTSTAPNPVTQTTTHTFTCTVKGLCGNDGCGADQTWTQTAVTVYTAAVNAWNPAVTYSGIAPTANPAPLNGVCGGNAGACVAGTATGAGLDWSCLGLYGGKTTSCIQGSCGTSQWSCATGLTANQIYASNTSTWNCDNESNNSANGVGASCHACDSGYGWNGSSCTLIVNGACAGGQYGCGPGAPVSESDANGTSNWVCQGSSNNGGSNSATCTSCDSGYAWTGSACGKVIAGACSPSRFGCSSPAAGTSGADNGATSSWVCPGTNGGANASCQSCDGGYNFNGSACAPIVTGVCGGSQWSCAAGTGISGADNGSISTWICQGGNSGGNSGTCAVCDAGHNWDGSSCAPIVNGACGGGQWQCASGTGVSGYDNGSVSTWYCQGSNTGGTSPQCAVCDAGHTGSGCAPIVNGQCSTTDWSCNAGTPAYGTQDTNYDYWYCLGINTGANSGQCSDLTRPAQTGVCGSSQWSCNTGTGINGSDSGSISSWVCQGANGGGNSGTCTSCDSGYVRSGGGCLPTYSCSLGTLEGTSCVSSYPATAAQSCPASSTVSSTNGSCIVTLCTDCSYIPTPPQTTQPQYNNTCGWTAGRGARSGAGGEWICLVSPVTTYTCPNGGTLSGTTCTIITAATVN